MKEQTYGATATVHDTTSVTNRDGFLRRPPLNPQGKRLILHYSFYMYFGISFTNTVSAFSVFRAVSQGIFSTEAETTILLGSYGILVDSTLVISGARMAPPPI